MKGIYLCSRKHRLPKYDLVYNDIIDYDGIDIIGDCLTVDINEYDFLIATPPCNYYSRANYRRDVSTVALSTKDILPNILEKFVRSGKPFIVENVCNYNLLPHLADVFEFTFGNHTFYTNVFFFVPDKSFSVKQNKANVCRNKRDGNYNVDFILNIFCNYVVNEVYELCI